jgi:membrane associated rhomboid family serine protease
MFPIRDLNPSSSTPVVAIIIAAACVVVFLYQFALGVTEGQVAEQSFVYKYGVIPFEIRHGVQLIPVGGFMPHGGLMGRLRGDLPLYLDAIPVSGLREGFRFLYLPIFFSMFLHGGVFHLAVNMLFLWIFGNNVEDSMGHFRFLAFYLICGVVASVIHIATNLDSQVPTIGASGAIAGVMGAYIVLYPHARILTLVPLFFYFNLVELPAFVFLGFWFLMQLLMAGRGGNVAWFAHIGGFVAGLMLVRKFVKYSPRRWHRYG